MLYSKTQKCYKCTVTVLLKPCQLAFCLTCLMHDFNKQLKKTIRESFDEQLIIFKANYLLVNT